MQQLPSASWLSLPKDEGSGDDPPQRTVDWISWRLLHRRASAKRDSSRPVRALLARHGARASRDTAVLVARSPRRRLGRAAQLEPADERYAEAVPAERLVRAAGH